MKPVLTSTQMREVDRLTTASHKIASIDLMENASRAVFREIAELIGGSVEKKTCIVLCGKGNNGGDGIAVARMLLESGADVEALLIGKIADTKGDAKINFERFSAIGGCCREIETVDDFNDVWSQITGRKNGIDLIVDSLFGTGLDRPLTGIHEHVIQTAMAGSAEASRVSIDLPSGVDADRAEPIGYSFKPDMTVTFTALKIANVLPPNSLSQGELKLCAIGSPTELLKNASTFVSDSNDARDWFSSTEFTEDSYKKSRGSLLIAAGSRSFPGAAVLAANGAMRSGVGMVTVLTPESALEAVATRVVPEVMVAAAKETDSGAFAQESFDSNGEMFGGMDVVLIGCGLTSDEKETREFVRAVVTNRSSPVVIDADGLNALSPFDLRGDERYPLILTPHEGEFRRLIGNDKKTGLDERIAQARGFAEEQKVICVLKGERTLIFGPDGTKFINPTGNSGLGKAGNGDTLAGIIAGFVTQTAALYESASAVVETGVFSSVVAAVYISGLAGDIAEQKFGKRVMTASDVRECLSEAFASLPLIDDDSII